jgi:hypothetical protein
VKRGCYLGGDVAKPIGSGDGGGEGAADGEGFADEEREEDE